MKSIKFSESELEFLKNHYELELIEAESYISEIKNILKKLGAEIKAAEPEKPRKKRGRPRKVKDEGGETKNVIARNEVTKQDERQGMKAEGGRKKKTARRKKTTLKRSTGASLPPPPPIAES